MIRPLLVASVLALAVPAVAQNATQDDMNKPAPTEGVASPDAQDQTSPNMSPGATPNRDADDTEATTDHSQMNHGNQTGTTATPGQSGTTNSGSMGTGSADRAAPGYTGMGGPAEMRDYPVCSRTVTDSCMQVSRRGRPRR